MTSNYIENIRHLTTWLRDERDLNSARLAMLLRQNGINTKTALCVKIFPDTKFPESGIVITAQKEIFQFTFNPSFIRSPQQGFDEWHNLTERYLQHQWRDEILAGLEILKIS